MAIAIQSHAPRRWSTAARAVWWTVTVAGSVTEEQEQHRHLDARSAFDDFAQRIRQLELAGFEQDGEEATLRGRWWSRDYLRNRERVTVRVDRPRV